MAGHHHFAADSDRYLCRCGLTVRAMVKLNKIYTRTGDDGTTGLVDGSRIAKNANLMAAIGDVDEANSLIGFALRALGRRGDEGPVDAHPE
jgi:hypothetical protein